MPKYLIDIIGLSAMLGLTILTLGFTFNEAKLSISHDKQCEDLMVKYSSHDLWWSGLRALPEGHVSLKCDRK